MNGATKLTKEQVEEIKTLFDDTDLSNSQIANLYDVSTEHIRKIRNGIRWNPETISYKAAHLDIESLPKNHYILRVMTSTKVLVATSITLQQVNTLKDFIEDIYINKSGGTTIIVGVKTNEEE